jgi:hypothetical protein
MKIKNFSSFTINESLESVNEFLTKVREDYDVIEAVKGVIISSVEQISGKNITNEEVFREIMESNTNVDGTDLAGFSFDDQLNLCIYEEEYNGTKCPETSFDDLTGIIADHAINGLQIIVDEYLTSFVDRVIEFMTNNKLDYSNIHAHESFGMLAPLSQKSIESGYISIYRDGDEDPKFGEYTYEDEELGVKFYITKRNIK